VILCIIFCVSRPYRRTDLMLLLKILSFVAVDNYLCSLSYSIKLNKSCVCLMIPYFNVLPCPTSAGHILATDLDVIMPACLFSSGKYFVGLIMYFTEDTVHLNCHISSIFFFRLQFSARTLRNHSISVVFLDRNLFLRLQRIPHRE
jgi:hypothetical protein